MKLDDEPTTGIDPLQALGKQLPWDRPDAARREAVRSSLLVAASETAPGRSTRAPLVIGGFIAGVLAAAAVAFIVVRTNESTPSREVASHPSSTTAREHYAVIDSSSVAEVQHVTVPTTTGSDEIVRVRSGTVRLAVPAVRAGDRVRTRTGNANVEGTGAYEVVVTADALAHVKVTTGTATVLVDGHKAVFLSSGESWTAPVISAELTAPVAPPTPTPAPSPRSRTAPTAPAATPPSAPATASASAVPIETPSAPPIAPPVAAVTTTPTEQHFRAGWALLRDGNYAAAADELALAAAGDEPLASDARYFQAVALTKAGRSKAAEAVLVTFLDRAPSSARRGRAAVMLGRLLVARGDAASARAWFIAAQGDSDASVVAAAKAGLAALAAP